MPARKRAEALAVHAERADQDQIERHGWRLVLALPEAAREHREELVDFVGAIAASRSGTPLRRSRRATTFNLRFRAKTGQPFDLFVKLIDAPRGIQRLKHILRGSASARVARITARLLAAGLSAPPIWMRGRAPADGRELIVTPRAEGRGPLNTLEALSLIEKRAVLRALGAEIARMHRAGFVHGDLTPFNIFAVCEGPPRFIFLDHERTRHNFLLGRRRRALRNLVQLGRFKLPGMTRTDRLRILFGYAVAMKSRNARKLARRVAAMLERRLRRDRGFATVAPLRAEPALRGRASGAEGAAGRQPALSLPKGVCELRQDSESAEARPK
jgi:hypothetical protein